MALSYVQTVFKNGNNVASFTTNAFVSTAGSMLIATIDREQTIASISDSQAQTWVPTFAGVAQGIQGLQQWYVTNNTGSATHTVTINFTTTGYGTLAITEFTGQTTGGALDQANSAIDTSAGTAHTTPSITTTFANSVIVAAAAETGFSDFTWSNADGTYTVALNNPGHANLGLLIAYKIVSVAGANDYDYTTSIGKNTNHGIANFREALVKAPIFPRRFNNALLQM